MKDYHRKDPMFSLCGLNCGLCPIHHMANGCPGCGGGEGHQPCAVIRCAREHGGVESCALCAEYPCAKHHPALEYDSFITSRRKRADLECAQQIGFKAYREELEQKTTLLRELLENYNDGRRKSFYCLAVNLLELEDVRVVMDKLTAVHAAEQLPLKERAGLAADLFQEMAKSRGVVLRLIKAPKKETRKAPEQTEKKNK